MPNPFSSTLSRDVSLQLAPKDTFSMNIFMMSNDRALSRIAARVIVVRDRCRISGVESESHMCALRSIAQVDWVKAFALPSVLKGNRRVLAVHTRKSD
jgi:hypothetical protein